MKLIPGTMIIARGADAYWKVITVVSVDNKAGRFSALYTTRENAETATGLICGVKLGSWEEPDIGNNFEYIYIGCGR